MLPEALSTVAQLLISSCARDEFRGRRCSQRTTLPRRDTVWPRRSPEPQGRRTNVVVQAYILIQTEVGKAASVAREIADIKGVTMAEDVTGPYDVIVRAEARNVDELGKLVVAKVQGVDGITRTLTCPVVHL
jgi:DNA-binding Lrp family transcriptional regulator